MQWQFLTSGFLSYVKEEVFLKGAILKQDKETISTILCHYATASSLFFFLKNIPECFGVRASVNWLSGRNSTGL